MRLRLQQEGSPAQLLQARHGPAAKIIGIVSLIISLVGAAAWMFLKGAMG
ncbi:MAG: hypothetical protein QOF48_3292 [Verrucomicrobiota bacterium]|jgi:hypothetical protein